MDSSRGGVPPPSGGANKRRRTASGSGDPRASNDGEIAVLAARHREESEERAAASAAGGPVVHLNVGGARRDVRRSLLRSLREASRLGGGGERNDGQVDGGSTCNPLCDILLAPEEHWSDVPTTADADGTVRAYVDRNPAAFDDLLNYVEFGEEFLRSVVAGEDAARLARLRAEGDYFTVASLAEDIDGLLHGGAATFSSEGWASIAGKCCRNSKGEINGWKWGNFSGNDAVASPERSEGRSCGHILRVKAPGTYLAFFSLHSIAVTALPPGHGYRRDDEFVNLCLFHGHRTRTGGRIGDDTYPVLRCGAFDYRKYEKRQDDPLLFTAACVEPVSLRAGDLLNCAHGTGVARPAGGDPRIEGAVNEHRRSEFEKNPECAQYITLVKLPSDAGVARFVAEFAGKASSEPTTVKWTAAETDFPSAPSTVLTPDGDGIRFKREGFYLILGRVACRLKKNVEHELGYSPPAVQLELRTRGGRPLQTLPEVISYPSDFDDEPYEAKAVEYGPVNDVVYAERDSTVRARAVRGACFVGHGCRPVSFGKLPAQSLSAIRLGSSCRVDRYQVAYENSRMSFRRALGVGDLAHEDQPALFSLEDEVSWLTVLADCQCILVGSLSSQVGSVVFLNKNGDEMIGSQVCRDSGRGSHTFSGVIELEEGDYLELGVNEGNNSTFFEPSLAGHLAFVVMEP